MEQSLILCEYHPMTHISDPISIIGAERVYPRPCTTYHTGNPSLAHLNSISGEGLGGPYSFPTSAITYVQKYTCTQMCGERRETFAA